MSRPGSLSSAAIGRSTLAAARRRLVLGIVLAAWGFLVVSCASQDAGVVIDLSASPPPGNPGPAQTPPGDTLVLAVAAVNSPMSTFGSYAELAGFMGDRLGMNAEFVSGKTYAEINSLLRAGEATLAIVCSGAYVNGHDEFNLELVAVPIIAGQAVYYSYLITRKDSPITGWQDLRGRTFAFTDPLSNSGRLVPLYQLSLMGETPRSLFSNYIFTYSHDNSIKAVARKLVDAASVDSLVYDYAVAQGSNEASSTKIVWGSPPFGINPVVVNPNLDPSLKARIRALLLGMHTTEEGRRILDRLSFDRFVPVSEHAYDSIRDMARAVGARSAP